MTTHPLHRNTCVRPIYRGSGGRTPRHSRIRASDLPTIATALGISVNDLIATGKRVHTPPVGRTA